MKNELAKKKFVSKNKTKNKTKMNSKSSCTFLF